MIRSEVLGEVPSPVQLRNTSFFRSEDARWLAKCVAKASYPRHIYNEDCEIIAGA